MPTHTRACRLLPELSPGGVPPERLLCLRGASGDLADAAAAAGGCAKKALRWLPRGLLRFSLVGGPTPGSLALLHMPRCAHAGSVSPTVQPGGRPVAGCCRSHSPPSPTPLPGPPGSPTRSGTLLAGGAVAPKTGWLRRSEGLAVGRAASPAAAMQQKAAVKRLIMQAWRGEG